MEEDGGEGGKRRRMPGIEGLAAKTDYWRRVIGQDWTGLDRTGVLKFD